MALRFLTNKFSDLITTIQNSVGSYCVRVVYSQDTNQEELARIVTLFMTITKNTPAYLTEDGVELQVIVLGSTSADNQYEFNADTFFTDYDVEELAVSHLDFMSRITNGGIVFSPSLNQFGVIDTDKDLLALDSGINIKVPSDLKQSLIGVLKTKKNKYLPNFTLVEKEVNDLKHNILRTSGFGSGVHLGDRFVIKPYEEIVAAYGEDSIDENIKFANSIHKLWGSPFLKGHSWMAGKPMVIVGYNSDTGIITANFEGETNTRHTKYIHNDGAEEALDFSALIHLSFVNKL